MWKGSKCTNMYCSGPKLSSILHNPYLLYHIHRTCGRRNLSVLVRMVPRCSGFLRNFSKQVIFEKLSLKNFLGTADIQQFFWQRGIVIPLRFQKRGFYIFFILTVPVLSVFEIFEKIHVFLRNSLYFRKLHPRGQRYAWARFRWTLRPVYIVREHQGIQKTQKLTFTCQFDCCWHLFLRNFSKINIACSPTPARHPSSPRTLQRPHAMAPRPRHPQDGVNCFRSALVTV